MKLNWIDRLGDWNPQLLREIKGRLKTRNFLVAGAISLLGQFITFMYFQTKLPVPLEYTDSVSSRYCTGSPPEYGYMRACIEDTFGNFVINWQLWSLDLFVWLSIIGFFALLVGGTHLLISDLATEERRDTLNFIRLSPQSAQSILVGKLLGVPILLYIVVGFAVPLHVWSGLAAQIPLNLILGFYAVVVGSCLFFYSAALLFGLVTRWLVGFQAWLGSGTVLLVLWLATIAPIQQTPANWVNLFSPSLILYYLVKAAGIDANDSLVGNMQIENLQWFYLPVGAGAVSAVVCVLLNYGVWTYWSWQALQRRFPNPSKTMLSKGQSYLLVACFEVIALGFAVQSPSWSSSPDGLVHNYNFLLIYNLLLALGLIVTLTPQRQTLQDWARYRRASSHSKGSRNRLIRDLIWGEKSPALVAIALNLIIISTMMIPWIVLGLKNDDKIPALLALVISMSLTLIYAAVAQLLLFLRTQKYALWITGALGSLTLLPPVVLSLLSLEPGKAAGLWLFTAFPWAAIEHASRTSVFLALLGQWSLLALLSLQMTRQLKQAGASASKSLLA